MSFLDFLFGTTKAPEPQPGIRFGRYTDAYKTTTQYDAWDASVTAFDKEDYLSAFKAFFQYLRDDKEDNVHFTEENGGIRFEIWQGSRAVHGFVDKKQIRAEAKIAKAEQLHLGFMRRLVELNYGLSYCRYALDKDNAIVVLFDSLMLDATPHKIYYALREVATQADKLDDLLIDEFEDGLIPLECGHRTEVSQAEKDIKYDFIINNIQKTLEIINTTSLDKAEYPGAVAYLLLQLTYKLDYLTKPEGFMMETLERIHRQYFVQDGKNFEQKNAMIIKELQGILARDKAQLQKEFYQVTSTFGITRSEGHERLISFIDNDLQKMDWYQQKGYNDFALAIPVYIAASLLFNCVLPKPDKQLLHLFMMIIEADYFKKLGFTINYYDSEKQQFDIKNIKKSIKDIILENKEKYPDCNPNTDILKFENLCNFSRSYLLMMKDMVLTKA